MEYNYKCPKCKNKFMVEKKISKYNPHETCPECGVHHDRDENAAINIRNEGMRIALA